MLLEIHPVLPAKDVATSVRFYEALGFTLTFFESAMPQYAALRRDGVELHLQWADGGQWPTGVDRPCVRFLVRDVDALFGSWESRGAPVGREGPWARPGDTPWGTREFHVRDPGGNVLQFYAPRGARAATTDG